MFMDCLDSIFWSFSGTVPDNEEGMIAINLEEAARFILQQQGGSAIQLPDGSIQIISQAVVQQQVKYWFWNFDFFRVTHKIYMHNDDNWQFKWSHSCQSFCLGRIYLAAGGWISLNNKEQILNKIRKCIDKWCVFVKVKTFENLLLPAMKSNAFICTFLSLSFHDVCLYSHQDKVPPSLGLTN